MKKISTTRRTSGASLGLMAKTGSHCPANGFWRPEDRSGNPVFVFEGSIMPVSSSGSTVWFLEDAVVGAPAYLVPHRA